MAESIRTTSSRDIITKFPGDKSQNQSLDNGENSLSPLKLDQPDQQKKISKAANNEPPSKGSNSSISMPSPSRKSIKKTQSKKLKSSNEKKEDLGNPILNEKKLEGSQSSSFSDKGKEKEVKILTKTMVPNDFSEFEEWLNTHQHIREADFSKTSIDDQKLPLLINWLKVNEHLTGLTLKVRGLDLVKTISKVLFTPLLSSLKFCWSRLECEGAKALMDALPENARLETLSIRENNLKDEGLEVVSNELKQNRTISILDISSNGITEIGIKHFVLAINQHPSLTRVNLRGNFIEDRGIELLQELVETNPFIIELELTPNLVDPIRRKKIEEICGRNLSHFNELILACKGRDYKKAEELLGKRVPAHAKDKNGVSPLYIAASQNDPRLMKLLLRFNPFRFPKNPMDNQTPLDIAQDGEMAEIIQLFLGPPIYPEVDIPPEFCCPISRQLMRDPVFAADGEVYERQMIEQHFSHTESALSPISHQKFEHTYLIPNSKLRRNIESFLEKHPHLKEEAYLPKEIQQRVVEAIDGQNEKALEALLAQDSRIFTMKFKNEKTLIELASQVSIPILKVVIEAYPEDSKPKLSHKLCALVSEFLGHKGLDFLLSNLPGSVEMTIDERLLGAVKTRSKFYIEALLALGADINTKGWGGSTPLHRAVKIQNEGIIAYLIQQGANTKARDDNGLTPTDLAKERKCFETAQLIENIRREVKIGFLITPLKEEIARLQQRVEILSSNQLSIYQSLSALIPSISLTDASGEKIAFELLSLKEELGSSLLKGKIATMSHPVYSEEVLANEDTLYIKTNDIVELLNQNFQLLDSVIQARQERQFYRNELGRKVVIHYAAESLLMRTFHMLGILCNNKELKQHHLPLLIEDLKRISKVPNTYFFRNQLMHYLFKFEGATEILTQTIEELAPLEKWIRGLKNEGRIELGGFKPLNTSDLSIFKFLEPKDVENEIVNDKELIFTHLKLYFKELRTLYDEAEYMKRQGPVFWEHDGVLHAAISGLTTAIGQRLRDLKEYHFFEYEHIIRIFNKYDPEPILKREVCGYQCEGTIFEINRSVWGHVFNEDNERPGVANGKTLKQATFELIFPSKLWQLLEFASNLDLSEISSEPLVKSEL